MKQDCVPFCLFIQRNFKTLFKNFISLIFLFFFQSRSLLYHCVPEMAITQGLALGHSLYDFISSYVPLKKVFSDIVNAYEEMFIMGIVALVSSIVSAFVIHFVASIASWIILVTISVLLLGKNSEPVPEPLHYYCISF